MTELTTMSRRGHVSVTSRPAACSCYEGLWGV